MRDDERVSVIIPVYNVLPYLREALDSVIHQSYSNLEIIVVDDGSTDGSGNLCDEYKTDARVKVIHQGNRGLSGARNAGLENMTGEYVAFLDPDDAFCADMIEELMDCIHQHRVDIVACGYDRIVTEGCLIDAKSIDRSVYSEDTILSAREALIDLLENRFSFAVWNKIYRKQIWEDMRFPEGHVYEDVWVIPQMLEKCEQIAVVSRVLIHHRVRAMSITHTHSEINIRDDLWAKDHFIAFAEQAQWSIPRESIRYFRETYLRALIFLWADIRIKENGTKMDCFSEELAGSIRQLSSEVIEKRETKTKVVWWMFQHCPGMIPLAQKLYWKLKLLLHCNCKRG